MAVYDYNKETKQLTPVAGMFGSGGGANNIVEGYRNNTDGLFYEENTYITPITGAENIEYIDLPNNKTYRWNGTAFVRLDDETVQITTSPLLTLTVAGWDSQTKQQTVTFAHDTAKRNEIDITLSELSDWADCGVIPVSETATGITFECETIPEDALTFKVVSMEVS